MMSCSETKLIKFMNAVQATKHSPFLQKTENAEKALDAAVDVVCDMNARLMKLEEKTPNA